MTMRSGRRKSEIAEPSRRNSGLEATENSLLPGLFADDLLDHPSGSGGHRRFRDDHLVSVHVLGDRLGDLAHERQVGRAVGLRGRSDRDENGQRALDRALQIRREAQAARPLVPGRSLLRGRARRSEPGPAGGPRSSRRPCRRRRRPCRNPRDTLPSPARRSPSPRRRCSCASSPTGDSRAPAFARYHSTDRRRPSSSGTRARKPRSRSAFSTEAYVTGTSPGCAGCGSSVAFRPVAASRASTSAARVTGCAPPRLRISKGRSLSERGHDAVRDVVDVRVVPARAAVPEEGDGRPLLEASNEAGDRHLRSLAGAVDREEAQAGGRQTMEVVRVEDLELARPLGRGVGRDRAGRSGRPRRTGASR